ncbi:hypothetical protein RAS1_35400 [Phycisphaerae bacterium RAS1]|nr:hypothetical protein RAS1_35400 [Phycisphaerae bacterium RAS1]
MFHGMILALAVSSQALEQVFLYECAEPPVAAGWDVIQVWCDPAQWVEASWFNQRLELCPGYPPPNGQTASYRRGLADFVGAPAFFVEWRVQTDAPRSEIVWGGGAILAAADEMSAYSFYVTSNQAKLIRANWLPIIIVDIATDAPHTYRLEVFGSAQYAWYIDGLVADVGVPVASFPLGNAEISWTGRSAYFPNTTRWDYIRYGTLPIDASGDYNSDGSVDEFDLSFFVECLLGEGVPSGPGCRFADFDADGDTDCDDWVSFRAHWTGPPAMPPIPPPCAIVGDTNCDGAVNVLDINPFILALSDPAAYAAAYPTCEIANGDVNGDGNVDVLDINPFVALLSGT